MIRLFQPPPRKAPRVMAHATDAGLPGGHFECANCGLDLGWLDCTDTEIRRGVPCPKCNPAGTPGMPDLADLDLDEEAP